MFEDNARGYTTWWTMRSSWKTYVKEVGGLMLWDMCTREAAHMHKDICTYVCVWAWLFVGMGEKMRVSVWVYVCMSVCGCRCGWVVG